MQDGDISRRKILRKIENEKASTRKENGRSISTQACGETPTKTQRKHEHGGGSTHTGKLVEDRRRLLERPREENKQS